jgi:hypothetical protein
MQELAAEIAGAVQGCTVCGPKDEKIAQKTDE